jgi:hypothetical protein
MSITFSGNGFPWFQRLRGLRGISDILSGHGEFQIFLSVSIQFVVFLEFLVSVSPLNARNIPKRDDRERDRYMDSRQFSEVFVPFKFIHINASFLFFPYWFTPISPPFVTFPSRSTPIAWSRIQGDSETRLFCETRLFRIVIKIGREGFLPSS